MDVELCLLIGSIFIFLLSIVLAFAQQAPVFSVVSPRKKPRPQDSQKERRIYPRYKTSLRMKYATPAGQGVSWISDIGRGGFRVFLANKAFKVGASLEIEIGLPNVQGPVLARGSIIWKQKDEAGIGFSAVRQDDVNRIIQYIGERRQLSSPVNRLPQLDLRNNPAWDKDFTVKTEI